MGANNLILGTLAITLAVWSSQDNPAPQPEITQEARRNSLDLDRVYRTVYGEVRGQSDREVEAVTHIIFNRWEKGWAETLHDVVMQCDPYRERCQFSVWNLNDPNLRVVISDSIEESPRYQQIKAIVDRVIDGRLRGVLNDPTNGGDHYWHPPASPRWAKGHAVKVIGAARIINIRG